jgi:hypothetical protein
LVEAPALNVTSEAGLAEKQTMSPATPPRESVTFAVYVTAGAFSCSVRLLGDRFRLVAGLHPGGFANGPDLMTGRGCAKQKWGTIEPPGDCQADALEPASDAASPAEASDARTRNRPANARHAATSRRPRGRFVPERIRGRISAVRTQIAAFLGT